MELKKTDSKFHEKIGKLASQIYVRKSDLVVKELDFGGVHFAEDYLIGKFAASFAAQKAQKRHKGGETLQKIHERATKKQRQIDLNDHEREILLHFSNERVYVNTDNGELAPTKAVEELLVDLYPVQ
jgi:hypothetical protein